MRISNGKEPQGGGSSGHVASGRRRRWRWVAAGVPFTIALFFAVTVFTGFPGLRPSMSSLNSVADKINECSPGAAKVDWVTGTIDTAGEPMDKGMQLTPDERKMLRVNGKVGIICGAIK